MKVKYNTKWFQAVITGGIISGLLFFIFLLKMFSDSTETGTGIYDEQEWKINNEMKVAEVAHFQTKI